MPSVSRLSHERKDILLVYQGATALYCIYMFICILGRQPAIGLGELESLYGANAVTPAGAQAALVDAPVDFSRLGGSVKAATFLTTLSTTNSQKVFDYIRRELPNLLQHVPEGKVKLGVSLYGLDMPVSKLNAGVLSLKKVVKQAGRSVRVVPNTELALSSAQTYHNQLTSAVGMELICVRDGDKTHLGRVTDVQDINSYTMRDRSRPKRDAFVGMLPPKLAQTIINLASGQVKTPSAPAGTIRTSLSEGSAFPAGARQDKNWQATGAERPSEGDGGDSGGQLTLLDPFCGTGVVLQEAALMRYAVYGTDNSEKMVRYTRDNLNWLQEKLKVHANVYYETADATTHTWRQPIDLVACEGYLGQPLGGQQPTEERLQRIIHECNGIMRDFLKNTAPQLRPGTRLCIAAPAWFIKETTYHLPTLDDLEDLGYNRIDFEHAGAQELIYRREDQIVGRELVVLAKE